jgi:hypothetical protein
MPQSGWLYIRRMLPLTDIKSHVFGWRCSHCDWTANMTYGCTGMTPAPEVIATFHIHHCDEHIKYGDISGVRRASIT